MQLSRVLLQVEVPTETLSADSAGERLLLVVGVHVEREVVDLMERLTTGKQTGSIIAKHMHFDC